MIKNSIGISFFLKEHAEGHFYSVHSSYHNEFRKRGVSNIYLGNGGDISKIDWLIPAIFYNPLNLSKITDLRELNDLRTTYINIKAQLKTNKVFIYFFEANMIYWLITALICRLTGNIAHVNLIRSDLIIKEMNDNPQKFLICFNFCKFISGNLVTISVLSEKLSVEIERLTGVSVDVIPTFSGIEIPKKYLSVQLRTNLMEEKVLIAAPYPSDLARLNEILFKNPEIKKKIIVSTWVKDIESYINHDVKIINEHLSNEDYLILLLKSKHVVLLYTDVFHVYGSSSKIYDAAKLGVPICVTLDSSAANQVENLVSYSTFNPGVDEELVRAIINPKFIMPKKKIEVPDAKDAVDYLLCSGHKRNEFWIKKILLRYLSLKIEKIIFDSASNKSIIERIISKTFAKPLKFLFETL